MNKEDSSVQKKDETKSTLADNISLPAKNYIPNIPEITSSNDKEENANDYKKLKDKLEDFKKKVIKKFPFTRAIGILPAYSFGMFEEDEAVPKEIAETKPIHLIILIPEEQYKNIGKIKTEIIQYVKESGENLWIHVKTSEVDLWGYGLDSKYEFLDAIAMSFPLYDNGFLGAMRVAVIHKNLVLNWLNTGRVKYVATYAIAGSLVRGTADKTSDVDTFVVIDDTDVKRMSRIELLEKLRGKIVYDFLKEATALAGVKNILNVQVYLLTDFWQSVKDAQPVMFTFIRDGIPLYDRGTFIPWKRLLQMGKIKPSPEAIDLYMKEGDRTDEIVKRRFLDAMVDIYFGVVTPTQAMMMLAGYAPPVPKVLVREVREVLVEKEKVMSEKELKTLEKVVKLYKDYEHGRLKEISGKELDSLLIESAQYLKKMKELRLKLEKKMQEHQKEKISNEVFLLMKNILGNKSKEDLIKEFDKKLIKTGKIPDRMLGIVKEISKLSAKKKEDKPLAPSDMQRITRDAYELMSALTEYVQRKEFASSEKEILHISYSGKKAELLIFSDSYFLVKEDGKILKMQEDSFLESDRQELEKAIASKKSERKQNISTKLLEALRKELGEFEFVL